MNGRCETDPLDMAVDVCDRCYGEFCESHLVRPKGRRHPLCSDCALAVSGVRGSTKVELRGERRTAKKRRTALRNAVPDDEHVFEFFDHEGSDDVSFAGADPAPTSTPAQAPNAKPAPVAGADTEPAVDTPDDTDRAPGNAEPGDSATADEPPPTPAVAKLEQLRREAEASTAARTGAEVGDDADPPPEVAARPKPRPAPAPRSSRPPRRDTPAEATPPTAPAAAGLAPTGSLPNRQSTVPPGPPPERVPVAKDSDDASPTTTSPGPAEDRRRRVPPPTHRRPTAPMIGEVRNVAGRRAEDRQPTPSPAAHRNAHKPADNGDAGPALNAVEVFDARRNAAKAVPPSELPSPTPTSRPKQRLTPAETGRPQAAGTDDEVARPSGRADVDSKGDWIPPILRGISPDADEAKADLPHRSRRSS